MKFIAAILANVTRIMKKKFLTCDHPTDYSKENKTALSKKKIIELTLWNQAISYDMGKSQHDKNQLKNGKKKFSQPLLDSY